MCFVSIASIGGKIYSNHAINMNILHKDSKYMVTVIITLGTSISAVETLFYDELKQTDLEKRARVLKHLYGRIIMN